MGKYEKQCVKYKCYAYLHERKCGHFSPSLAVTILQASPERGLLCLQTEKDIFCLFSTSYIMFCRKMGSTFFFFSRLPVALCIHVSETIRN